MLKPTPPGWPRISQSIYYEDPHAAIDWLCAAFGFELVLKVEGDQGEVVHSELRFGEGLIMVGGSERDAASHHAHEKDNKEGEQDKEAWRGLQKSPKALAGVNTQSACVFVDDVDAHCERARAHGGVVVREPITSDYGEEYWSDRAYGVCDLEGHLWWFMQRMRTGKG